MVISKPWVYIWYCLFYYRNWTKKIWVFFFLSVQKLWLFRQWKGYKSDGLKIKAQKPFFQVKKRSGIFTSDLSCEIAVRSGSAQHGCYKLKASAGKSAFKLTDSNGRIVAKVGVWFFL